jgi:hypothetical protein
MGQGRKRGAQALFTAEDAEHAKRSLEAMKNRKQGTGNRE